MDAHWVITLFSTVLIFGLAWLLHRLLRRGIRRLRDLQEHTSEETFVGNVSNHLVYRILRRLLQLVLVLVWLMALMGISQFYPTLLEARRWVEEGLGSAWIHAANLFVRPLLHVGPQAISIRYLLVLFVLITGVFMAAGFSRLFLRRHLLTRFPVDLGTREALASIASYIVLGLGLIIALDIAGLDLSTLTVIAGALSIGIGFGLQNIVNNFVSGLIILIERPIKVGDRVEVGSAHGRVVRISARSTTVKTNDNVDIIVPNADFISGRVVNWSQDDEIIRFRVPVGVAYGTDVEHAMHLMEQAAAEVPEILTDPPPSARFLAFGDNALELELRIWTQSYLHRKGAVISHINVAVYNQFLRNDIPIPFPQRDLHIRSWPSGEDENNTPPKKG